MAGIKTSAATAEIMFLRNMCKIDLVRLKHKIGWRASGKTLGLLSRHTHMCFQGLGFYPNTMSLGSVI